MPDQESTEEQTNDREIAYWHYRLILHDQDSKPWYGLHEVYYDQENNITGWTENPVRFTCDAEEGIEGVTHALANAVHDVTLRQPLVLSELPSK